MHVNTDERRETTFCSAHLSKVNVDLLNKRNSLSHNTQPPWQGGDGTARLNKQAGTAASLAATISAPRGSLFPRNTWTDEDSNLQELSLSPALPEVTYVHMWLYGGKNGLSTEIICIF